MLGCALLTLLSAGPERVEAPRLIRAHRIGTHLVLNGAPPEWRGADSVSFGGRRVGSCPRHRLGALGRGPISRKWFRGRPQPSGRRGPPPSGGEGGAKPVWANAGRLGDRGPWGGGLRGYAR